MLVKCRKDKIFVRNSKRNWNSTYKTEKVTKIEKNTKVMSEKLCLTGTARPGQGDVFNGLFGSLEREESRGE